MISSLDTVGFQIDECLGKIEEYQLLITKLKQRIRELSWQPIETIDGDVACYDDVA